MGLLTFIQIPCHHVLANEIALNLKYYIGLKHFFNINLGIGIIKKNYFFCLYFRHISSCFYSNLDRESSLDAEFPHPTSTFRHTFDGLRYPKNKKYLKKWKDDIIIPFFQVFLIFGVAESVKSMPSGYSLDAEFNSASNELSRSKFE